METDSKYILVEIVVLISNSKLKKLKLKSTYGIKVKACRQHTERREGGQHWCI